MSSPALTENGSADAAGTRRPSVAVVGGGFGGVGTAALLTQAGYHDVTVFERSSRVGGVWDQNTYPGAACDVPSHLYEFSFAPNVNWSRRYASGPEIQAYVEQVANDFGVADKVRLNTEVRGATFDEERPKWVLDTSAGTHEADVLVAACGQLSVPSIPAIPGLDDFDGPAFHTARWRHDVELKGRRVAIIGSGCSAIQTAPEIAPAVEHLDVYQRTAGWTIPKGDFAWPALARRLLRRLPALRRLDRRLIMGFMDLLTAGMTTRPGILRAFRAIANLQRRLQVRDPQLRRQLTPTDALGCKRTLLSDDWYPTVTRDNVSLVTDRIARITPRGVALQDGTERPADVLVLATGFHTHGFVAPMEIRGRNGLSLSEFWGELPRAYLGVTIPRFPNLFLLYGPNTNGGAGSGIDILESGISHVLAALRELEDRQARTIELKQEAADTFDRELRAALAGTVWQSGCTSWYVDANGNNPNQWPWDWGTYRRRTGHLAPGAYALDGSADPYRGGDAGVPATAVRPSSDQGAGARPHAPVGTADP